MKWAWIPLSTEKRGVKVIGCVPSKRYKRTSIVSSKLGNGIIELLQYEGSINPPLFKYWVESYLIPLLPPGTTVVLVDYTGAPHKKAPHTLYRVRAPLVY